MTSASTRGPGAPSSGTHQAHTAGHQGSIHMDSRWHPTRYAARHPGVEARRPLGVETRPSPRSRPSPPMSSRPCPPRPRSIGAHRHRQRRLAPEIGRLLSHQQGRRSVETRTSRPSGSSHHGGTTEWITGYTTNGRMLFLEFYVTEQMITGSPCATMGIHGC